MKKVFSFLIIISLFFAIVFLYAKYIGTMGFITKEYSLYNENLPTSFDGLKVVHFSDIHYGRAISENKILDIIDEINLINADIVVFTGDLIDKDIVLDGDDYEFLTNSFNNINAKYGKYAVLGNHDYYDMDMVIKVFNDSSFTYLENEYDIITSKNGEKIFISGIGNVLHNLDDVKNTINYSNNIGYEIVLVHEPDISDEIIDNYDVGLILGGHSHNGQIRLPIIGAVYTPPGAKVYYDEYYKTNNTYIYISSGIGVSSLDLRLFNRPSINFYRVNKR